MTRDLSERLTTGTVIVLIGLVLLLSTTGFVEMRSVWGWIAAIFILVGVWALVRSGFRNIVGPVMIIAIAGAFFLRNVGLLPDGVIGTWWPLFIILFGLLVMVNRSRRRQRVRLDGTKASEITSIAVFGTDQRRPTTDRFTGGELLAVFGDARLDLTNAEILNHPANVEALAVFGSAEIRVPEEWEVQIKTMSIFGDSSDTRTHGEKHEPTDEPELIVTGVALFGDIEIRN